MPFDVIKKGQLHLFGVDQDKLQLRGVLPVEQAYKHGIQSYRFSLPCCTGHEEVGHFCQVKDKRLVGDGLANGYWQCSIGFVEFIRSNQRSHGDDVWIRIGDFDADGAPSRDGGDDADAQGCETQGYVVL